MEKIKRCFLVAEGRGCIYPSSSAHRVTVTQEDPAVGGFANVFLSSPLFSTSFEGQEIPVLENSLRLTFLMVPNVYPGFYDVMRQVDSSIQLWFSLGLANLVIVENDKNGHGTAKLIQQLRHYNNVVACEAWIVEKYRIMEIFEDSGKSGIFSKCSLPISSLLPLNLKFAVSEFILSVDKFMSASSRFTPQYCESHQKTIDVAIRKLVSDLCFLHGDSKYTPSSSVLHKLNRTTASEALTSIQNNENRADVEELINDRHGRLIQFNSSLSYLYSQAYSGIFPLLSNNGLVNRHSLLGMGTAVAALFELVSQIERIFVLLPFDKSELTGYDRLTINPSYLSVLQDPSKYKAGVFDNDAAVQAIHSATATVANDLKHLKIPEDYYNRLAFFSGRLGFREYDFSATAAIQVLVESHSLEWHVINYTHEIMHNHVRSILNSTLINVPNSIRNEDYLAWLKNQLEFIANVHFGKQDSQGVTYQKFLSTCLVNFSINAGFFGSLSKESNSDLVARHKVDYFQPTPSQLKEVINQCYRDINEIFVHIIDFSYIYKRDKLAYVLSIWSSWSTIPSVTADLKQYIIRTLLVVAIDIGGKSFDRFNEAKTSFLLMLSELQKRSQANVFDKIRLFFDSALEDDIRHRFYNCIIVADIVYHFFIGRVELLFENSDENILDKDVPATIGEQTESKVIYDLKTNEFKPINLRSKTVFLLDQLVRQVRQTDPKGTSSDELVEHTSSWLLLSLSSFNKA